MICAFCLLSGLARPAVTSLSGTTICGDCLTEVSQDPSFATVMMRVQHVLNRRGSRGQPDG